MSNRIMLKLMLDIIMTALFLILIDPKNTGFTFHEIAGLTIGGLFTFHVILNWNWVKSITKNLFNPKLKASFRWYYVLNVISFISVLTIIITGVEISKVLFASGAGGNNHGLVVLHKWVSYFCLGLFGVHLVIHWRFIRDAVRKLTGALPRLGKVALGAGASVLVLYLLYVQLLSGPSPDEDRTGPRREPHSRSQTQVYESAAPSGTNSDSSVGTGSSTSKSETNSSKSSNLSTNTANNGDSVTLAEYLGKMFCSGCEKHCSLLQLQCDKGTRYLQEAKAEYQQQYGTTATVD